MSNGTVGPDDGRDRSGLSEYVREILIVQAQQDAQRLNTDPVDRNEMFAIQRFMGVVD